MDKRSEHERIEELEAIAPQLAVELGQIKLEMDRLRTSPALRGPGAVAEVALPTLSSFLTGPMCGFPLALLSFEAFGATAGTAVHDAKDAIDRAERALRGAPDRQAQPTADLRRQALERLASTLREVLDAARRAKNAVGGAATAAKKHRAARQALGLARTSFNEAENSLDEAARRMAESGSGSADDRHGKLNAAKQALDAARTKINDDLGHLQDALDAIEGDS